MTVLITLVALFLLFKLMERVDVFSVIESAFRWIAILPKVSTGQRECKKEIMIPRSARDRL